MHLTTSFKILGLDPDADEAQAKHAYKDQVRRWHPDQFAEGSATKADAEEQLKQINIAYARVKEHLAARRPRTAVAEHPPRPEPAAADSSGAPGRPPKQRSWVDHLFDTLNAFAGGSKDKTSAASAAAHRPPPKRFDQILTEMAGGSVSLPKTRRQPLPEAAVRRAASGCRRQRHGGDGVDAVGGAERPGPVKPVSRIRGIGRSR